MDLGKRGMFDSRLQGTLTDKADTERAAVSRKFELHLKLVKSRATTMEG